MPLAGGQERTLTSVLHDDRLPRREVAESPVAYPGVPELQTRRLDAAELTTRAPHVGGVGLRGTCDLHRVLRCLLRQGDSFADLTPWSVQLRRTTYCGTAFLLSAPGRGYPRVFHTSYG
jgi:hypothetical protein